MVKKKEVPDERLDLWKGRISAMKNHMEQTASKKGWGNLKKFYKGDYEDALKLNIPITKVNLVKSYVDTSVTDLFARNPKFKCNPFGKDGMNMIKAKVSQFALNFFWYSKKVKKQVKKCIKQSALIGYSWVKIGYSAIIDSEENGTEYLKEEEIYCTHVDNDAVWYDPSCKNFPDDCEWLIHTYMKNTQSLREKYKLKEIKSTSELSYGKGKDKKSPLAAQDKEMSRIYEIWDRKNNLLLIFCDGYTDGFVNGKDGEKWPYKIQGFPFEMLTFDTQIELDEEDNLPTSNIDGFIDQVLEKCKLRSMQLEHLKRFSRQMMYDKNKLTDEAEIAKYTKGIDGALIGIDGNPNDAIMPISYPPVQADMYAVENRIDMDYDRFSMQGGRQGVAVQTKSRTLGEVEEISAGNNKAVLDDKDTIEEFTECISHKVLALMKQYYKTNKSARIIGEITATEIKAFEKYGLLQGVSLQYNSEFITGEYDIEIVAGSTLPLDSSQRLNRLISIAKYAPAFGLGPDSVTSMYLGKTIMEEMELKDVEKAYDIDIQKRMEPKQPNPSEQMKMIKQKQDIDRGATDNALKKTRVTGNELSNIKKAAENAKVLNGEDKKNEMPVR